MLNQTVIAGRMVKDAELRYTQSQKPVASFTVACDRDYAPAGEKRETDFIDCTAWGNTAIFVDDHFHKGDMIIVSGRLQSREWTDRDGNKRKNWEIVADRVYFGEAKRREAEEARQSASSFREENASVSRFRELNGDGEIPF